MGGTVFGLAGDRGERWLAGAIMVAAAFRFLKWLVPFVFERLDVGRGELGKRLKHVELELDDYRELAMLLISVVAKLDATNPALTLAAERLRKRAPRASLELSELIDQLNAIPGSAA